MSITKRLSASLLALAVFFAACWAALLPVREQRLVSSMSRGEVDLLRLPDVPFSFSPYRTAARELLVAGPFEPETIGSYLRRAIDARPLYAPTWLDRAGLALRLGRREEALGHAETARALWPTRAELLWRLAMLRIRAGDDEGALSALTDYLASRPRDFDRVLVVARRLVDTSEILVDAVLPGNAIGSVDRGWFLMRLMAFARRTDDVPLAMATWGVASVPARAQAEVAVPHVDFLVAHGELAAAMRAWADFTGLPARRGEVYNGGFEKPAAGGGFDWRAGNPEGATAQRDRQVARSGCCSMRVDFDGSTNVHYHHLRLRVPVEGGGRYVLSGWVQGRGVTTRSGVYVDVRTLDAADPVREASPAATGSWEWARFRVSIDVPADAGLLEIRLRRDRTDALDNRVGGSVWLDDVQLAPASGAEEARGG